MPLHCDTRDGPVVKAAVKALETANLNYKLIWNPKASEKELKGIFAKTLMARKAGKDAQKCADDWFFENTIRLHRAGDGAVCTRMKPGGLSEGLVAGDPKESIGLLLKTVEGDRTHCFHDVMEKNV
jgi:hypothetical protein